MCQNTGESNKFMLIKCNECGKYFTSGNRPDGLPNGIGFVLNDGTKINVCTDCIIERGEEVRIE